MLSEQVVAMSEGLAMIEELTRLRNQNTGIQNQVSNLTNRVATLEHERHEVFTLRENLERLERSLMRAFAWIHHWESIHGGLPDVAPGVDHDMDGGNDDGGGNKDSGSKDGETENNEA
ncbi:hypothetical protein FDECE_13762 [Fusarium decemcellulare]|nr:hypothetical protein FDECE_13762 [Fusarium decemcellulare]